MIITPSVTDMTELANASVSINPPTRKHSGFMVFSYYSITHGAHMSHIVKVTTKGQATIPADIRKALGIRPGDQVLWEIDEEGTARVRRVPPLDAEYLKAVEGTLSDWHSEADDEAYRGL